MTEKFETPRQRAMRIAQRLAEGESPRTIAHDLGISARRVRHLMNRYAIPVSGNSTIRFGFHLSRRRAAIVKELAAEAGLSPSAIIDKMVSTVVDDGIEVARRKLGKTIPAKDSAKP